MINSEYLKKLNNFQKEAVLHTSGPLLIVAGAGSGKTKVLTSRIANIVEKNLAFPNEILAVTFTNKAAREMQNRIGLILNKKAVGLPWLGTFHSICAKILRKHAKAVNLTQNFTIIDQDDQQRLIKNICKNKNIDIKKISPNFILALINKWKNSGWYPNNVKISRGQILEKNMLEVYKVYQEKLIGLNACDFGDLILHCVKIFEENHDINKIYSKKFKYILVDEYQDTNYSQYLIVKALADRHENLCVVGDDSQSIYSFRGANIDNILNFKKHYPDSKTYKLEQNYRSTKNIVQAANSLINHNILKLDKTIWTNNTTGDKIILNKSLSDSEEGRYVSSNIFELKNNYQLKNSSFAVLYRTNAQSRSVEDALRKINIDYQVFGGLSFYQRKEVKDVLAYLRLIENLNDEESLRRIINFPPRGIGQTTLDKLVILSKDNDVSLFDSISKIDRNSKMFNSRTIEKLENFKNLILSFKIYSSKNNAYETSNLVVHQTKLVDFYRNDGTLESMNRIENIEELLNGVNDFIDQQLEIYEGDNSLSKYLQDVALYSETDKEIKSEKVSLMSIHMAKGLEFPIVYVVGLEENLFPSIMSINSREEIEEERRLFYVAMTRAKEKLILSHCEQRFKWGNIIDCEPSRFLSEIDTNYINNINNNRSYVRQKIDENKLRIKKLSSRNLKKINPNSISKIKKPLVNINLNEKVYHERFGEGIVEDIEGEGDNIRAKINFKASGEKKILLKFAKLKIIK